MLRVTIELVPDGDEERARQLAQLSVANDGTGTALNGHYDAKLTFLGRDGSTFVKTARIKDCRYRTPIALKVVAGKPIPNC